jgi:hypothetical protein
VDNLPGKLLTAWLLATLAACVFGWWLTRRYRAALPALMRAPLTDAADAAGAGDAAVHAPAAETSPAPLPSLAQWQRAEWRLIGALVGLSLVIALSRGALLHWQAIEGDWSWPRMLLLSLLMAWPVLPALAALQRWSRQRLLVALALWLVGAWALAMWRSNEQQDAATVVLWLAWEELPPAIAFWLLTLPGTRAAAPWLWPPLALMVFAAILGLDVLAWVVEHHLTWLAVLPQWLGPWSVFIGFAVAGVALAWWPVQRLARALARAYAQRWISELAVVFTAAWALTLGFDALGSGPIVLLPLLWIPLALALAARFAPRAAPPTLLVLRVFQQDANMQSLFDDVIERWRVVGNTVLIAGTDVVTHTLDAADLFDHLDGRLGARFVHSPADVPQRLAAFDWTPDADGRWRVNECYCHDQAWQLALAALVQRADVVLMDLRRFQAKNAGCRYELGVLAAATALQRVVVLTDAATDLATAKADAAVAPAGRFIWVALSAGASRRAAARQVIAALAGTAEAATNATRGTHATAA